MSIVRRILGSDEKIFAKHLASDLGKRYPASMDNNPQKKISPNRLTKVLEDTFNRAIAFQNEHRLGFFGRARLANNFRWELREIGYSNQFIETAIEGLVIYLSREAKKTRQTANSSN